MNILDILNVPLGYLLKGCYWVIPNYAAALLLFAIVVKILLFPLSIKQQKNMVKQASLRPKEMAIRKRYAGRTDKATQQKLNEEIMNLYQKENFNPMGGCLPMLIQFPILMSLYAIVMNPLKYICSMSAETISAIGSKITELYIAAQINVEGLSSAIVSKLEAAKAAVEAGKDAANSLTGIDMVQIMHHTGIESFAGILPEGFTAKNLPSFNVGPLNLGLTPSFKEFNILLLIPILTFVIVFVSMKLTKKMTYQPQQTGDAAMSSKVMDFTMPLLSVWITFTVPAVVGLYWIYQNILGTVQQYILKLMYPIPVFSEEEMKQAEKEMNGSIRREKKKVRSLHRIDEEDEPEPAPEKETPAESEGQTGEENKSQPSGESVVAPAPLKDESDKKRN
ncbi:MAG: YidC/Oxa1 family membrane protein insertase [Firmicutes bacterium]|nr:YidC/Oxa1 family membrane protein insertase [Bacillota bacterium]